MIPGIPFDYVPADFKALVAREVADADERALASLPPGWVARRPATASERTLQAVADVPTGTLERAVVRGRRSEGLCVGCGCPVDDYTTGCSTCRGRHFMRAKAAAA